MTVCTECGYKFSASEALCDDWKNPEKSYGCPACGTFFLRDMRVKPVPSVVGGLLGGGVGTPAVLILAQGIRSSDPTLIALSAVILTSMLIAGALLWRVGQTPLQVSPHRRQTAQHST